MRIKTSIALLTVLVLASQGASAAPSKEENIGVGSGAIIGAAAGGPVGLIIGAAIGAKLGDSMHKKSERIDSLQASLQASEDEVVALENGVDNLGRKVEDLKNMARPELVALMQAGIDMDLLFRTDEAALTDSTGERLHQMAATLAGMPEIQVQLDGFADERGDSAYNLALSEQRVEFIRSLFINAGVHPARISMAAHGESVAQNPDVDSYALERRVSVKLFIGDAPSLASNPR